MKKLLGILLGITLALNAFAGNKRTIEADNVKGIQTYVNYVKNATGQENTAGWATYADAAGVAPVDGTGGAPTLTWTRNTTTPLFLEADFLLTHTAANEQGNGVSYDAAIDLGDRGTTLGISFFTLLNSGTYTNNDLQVFAYDITNAALLNGGNAISLSSPVATTGGIVAGASVSPHFGSIYVPPTCASVRFIIHQAAVNATAYNIQFSKISLDNNPFVYKDLFDGWNQYQITTTGTNWTDSGQSSVIPYKAKTGEWRALINVKAASTGTVAARTVTFPGLVFYGNEMLSAIQDGTYGSQVLVTTNASASTVAILHASTAPTTYHISGDVRLTGKPSFATQDSATSEHVITPAKSGIEEVYYNGYTSKSSQIIKFKTQQRSSLVTLASVDNTSYTKFTALKKVIAWPWATVSAAASSENYVIHHYSSTASLKTSQWFNSAYGGTRSGASLPILMDKGDYLQVYGNNTNNETDSVDTQFGAIFVDFEQQMLSAMPKIETCYVKDVKASGTDGGTFTAGAWQTRVLNIINTNGTPTNGSCGWVTLSSNQFTLQPGKYKIKSEAPVYSVSTHQSKLYNITAAADVTYSSSLFSSPNTGSGYGNAAFSSLTAQVEIAAPTTYEIRHRCSSTLATVGFGLAFGLGPEIYTQVEITRLW